MNDFVTKWDDLTPREKEIFACFIDGKSDQQIGETLYLSVRTVATHVHHILKKFGAQSRSQLIVFYYRDSGITIIKEGLNYGIHKAA